MEMKSTRTMPASRVQVWDALRDPQVLKFCLPGCEQLSPRDGGGHDVTLHLSPLGQERRLYGHLQLVDEVVPEGYRILFEGHAPGSVKGEVRLWLDAAGTAECDVHYQLVVRPGEGESADAQALRPVVQGLEQITDGFFERLQGWLHERHALPQERGKVYADLHDVAMAMAPEALPLVDQEALENERLRVPTWMWIVLAAGILLFIVLMTQDAPTVR